MTTYRRREPSTSPVIRAGQIEAAILGVALYGTGRDWRGVLRAGFDPARLVVSEDVAAWEVIGPAMEIDLPAIAVAVLSKWRQGWASYYDILLDNRPLTRIDVAQWMDATKRLPRPDYVPVMPPEVRELLHTLIAEFR